jgi:hypothetical protein
MHTNACDLDITSEEHGASDQIPLQMTTQPLFGATTIKAGIQRLLYCGGV